MSTWMWVAIVVVVLWVAGMAIAVGFARSAAIGDRIEIGEEEDESRRDEDAAD